MKEWALCLPGTFPRLGPHAGALHACHDAFLRGSLEREVSFISTSSVSFIPASIAVQRSEESFVDFEDRLIHLNKKHFVSLHPELKKRAAVDILSILGLILAAHQTGKIKSPVLKYLSLAALAPAVFKIEKKTIKDIFTVESFLVYDNLRKLLLETLDFDLIFNSPIKIEVPAVNLNTAGWTLNQVLSDPPLYLNGWKNKGWVSVTNFRPEDINFDKEVRNLRYVEGGINGLRVYAHVNPGKHDGQGHIVDSAALSNLPINFAVNAGYSNIVVFHYSSRAEAPLDRLFTSWVDSLNRSFDITVSEMTRKIMVGYLRVNNDLIQLEKQRESLKRLEEVAHSRSLDDVSKKVIRQHIVDIEETMRSLSYAHKKRINFLFIGSDPLPDAHFSDFTQNQMLEGINIGWKAGQDAIPKINKMISD